MSNVAIYVRVSTQEQKQHGISVDAQEAACREWVHEQKHRLVGVYNDAGLSARAKYTKRNAMLKLLEDVRTGKIDLIVFTKLDRWFRNVADYYEVQAILEQNGVKWRAIQEDYETETASGRFKVNIMLAVAQDEADRTSERIKSAADYKKKKGEAVGRAPVGYKIEDKHFVIDPETEPGIRAFFETYMSTYSQTAAIVAARERGIAMNQTRCGRTLRNRTYCGDHFGTPCPAYITPEQFAAIRRVIDSKSRETKTKHTFIFSGLLRCGLCGGALTSAATPQRDRKSMIKYYRCCNHTQYIDRCEGTYANEKKLESYLLENIPMQIEQFRIQSESLKSESKDYTKEISGKEGKLSRLKELYIDGEIDRATFDIRADEIKKELEKLQTLAANQHRVPHVLSLPDDWIRTYLSLSDTGKRVFWRDTVRAITIYRDAPPVIDFLS